MLWKSNLCIFNVTKPCTLHTAQLQSSTSNWLIIFFIQKTTISSHFQLKLFVNWFFQRKNEFKYEWLTLIWTIADKPTNFKHHMFMCWEFFISIQWKKLFSLFQIHKNVLRIWIVATMQKCWRNWFSQMITNYK